jgi:hypothetical protein
MESNDLSFEASGPSRRETIVRLRTAVYGKELGYGPAAFEWGPTDERATHLLALSDGSAAVAMMRLLGPVARPFEMETSLDLNSFLRLGHPTAEITRFCIALPFRRITRAMHVYLGLIRLLYDTSFRYGIEDVLICTTPAAQKLYEFALFEALTPPYICYRPLGGVPHLLMRLHIPSLPDRCEQSNHLLKAAFAPSFLQKGTT